MKLKRFLDQRKIENFLPLRYQYVETNGNKELKLVSAIHNLLFIRSNTTEIKNLKLQAEAIAPMRYMIDRSNNQPMIIPDRQMSQFMAVCNTYDEGLVYLNLEGNELKRGDKVRITGGVFEGVEGLFCRIKGDRRVVVSIPCVMAVATAFIHPALIQKI